MFALTSSQAFIFAHHSLNLALNPSYSPELANTFTHHDVPPGTAPPWSVAVIRAFC